MSYLYQDDLTSLKDDGSLDPSTDDTDEEGPMVPEEDFDEDKSEEEQEETY